MNKWHASMMTNGALDLLKNLGAEKRFAESVFYLLGTIFEYNPLSANLFCGVGA